MGKALIIAEKPSVARDIARALGVKAPQKSEFFEDDDYVISSAVGHLLEIKAPDTVEVKRGKWSFANLPVIPPSFDLNPIAKTQDRLKLLAKLIKRKDIDQIINACDAGREGELIFRLIAQHTKAKQPIQRLWLQSMTQKAILDSFEKLRDDSEMLPLADAARCRSEADWLIGINGTRAMTAFNSQDGGFYLTTVGRVQTPTLTIVVEREEKIRAFVPRQYFEVHASFDVAAGEYPGRWFDPAFKKDETDAEKRAERIWDQARAQAIVEACQGKPGVVTEETKPSSQSAPQLFDLTSLQREANGRFGFSARATLSLAQALYERHKVLTYPRTDSRALPEDYIPNVNQAMAMLRDQASARLVELDSTQGANPLASYADAVIKNKWVQPNKRIFNDAKISDHFAIIPTQEPPKNLSEAELKLYDMVVRRFLSVFHPPAKFLNTTRITTVATHQFRTEGKVLIEPGWLAIYGRSASTGGEDTLVAVAENESATTAQIEARDLATRPPARYSEATLLSAMEGAGKTFESDELREAMSGKGLGTPATRAAIIEGLIRETYLIREGKELIPTTKAFQLLTLLRGLGVTELTKPELTGEWEHKLARIEQGGLARDNFMDEINAMTEQIVARAKNYGSTSIPGDYATLKSPCPTCGSVVKENYKRYACTKEGCEFSISKIPGSRQLEVAEAEELITNRTIGPLQGFRSRMGRPFAAIIKINDENKLEFDFGQNDDENAEPVDFSDQQSLGSCPKCGNSVYEHGMSYLCEKATGPEKTCDFKSGKVILQQEIEPEQMRKLLSEGKTDLLVGFVSSRTHRKFKAFLARGEDGKVGFEFEPRPEKSTGGAKGAKKGAKGSKADEATDAADDDLAVVDSSGGKTTKKKPA
ncbi:MAG: DNA topoisomerase III, partial [Burkholderiaceae bacterium]